jgi:hypothetical protein
VRRLAISAKRSLEARIAVMRAMSAQLDQMIEQCDDDGRAVNDCPILGALNANTTPANN